jgi:outer membrane lipoprotein-sorting protein
MNENLNDPGDEILESAFSAMRGRAIPDGPTERQIAETVAALSAAAALKPNIFSRMNNMKFITGMAASVLLVLGAALVAVVMLRSPEMTFGEIVETVKSAHVMSFEMTTGAFENAPPTHTKILANDQGQMCAQTDDGGRVFMDQKTGRMTMIFSKTKLAMVMDMKNFPKRPNQTTDFIEKFKKLQGDSAKDLGQIEIDGRKAEKFIANKDQQEFVIWADRKTREPIRIDVSVDILSTKMTASMTNFEFNPVVPPDAFSMDIPAGYSVKHLSFNVPDLENGEKNVTESLRGYAKRSGGKLPDKLDDMTSIVKLLENEKHPATQPSQEDMQWIAHSQMVKHFLGTLKPGEWKYLGAGKMSGDSHTLIFWYKSAKGYRGIFGDFSAQDLPAEPQ